MRTHPLILLLVAMMAWLPLSAQKIYRAEQFGIIPDQGINISPLVQQAITTIRSNHPNKEPVVLQFRPGVYDFQLDGTQSREYYISNHDQDNPKQVCFVIEQMENFTIDGGGGEFLFHGRMIPIAMLDSRNCTLRNFSIDFPNPQITQMQILENDTLNGVITYRIAPWVQYRIEQGRLIAYGENWEQNPTMGIAFEEQTKRLVFNTSDLPIQTNGVCEVAPHTIRAAWRDPRLISGTVVAMRSWHRPAPGIFLSSNLDTWIEQVKVHYAEGMGLLAQMCENITLDHFSVCLRGKDDPRYFTTQADATHFSGCKGVIRATDGLYENMMDDAINVHGTYLKVVRQLNDSTLIARYMHPQAYGFVWGFAGDSVQFVNPRTMELAGGVRVIAAISPMDQAEVHGAKEFRITFTQPLDASVAEGYGVENLEWTPQVEFSHNTIRHNRARGSLFSTPRSTLVEDNFFDHTSGSAILLCGDCNGWFETGACRSILIRKNRFVNSLTNLFQFTNAIISIYPEIPDLQNQQKYFHSGIVIEDNIFETFDAPILFARSVDGLIFRRNRIVENSDYPAFHWNKHRFLFERVVNFTLEENRFDGEFDPVRDVRNVEF